MKLSNEARRLYMLWQIKLTEARARAELDHVEGRDHPAEFGSVQTRAEVMSGFGHEAAALAWRELKLAGLIGSETPPAPVASAVDAMHLPGAMMSPALYRPGQEIRLTVDGKTTKHVIKTVSLDGTITFETEAPKAAGKTEAYYCDNCHTWSPWETWRCLQPVAVGQWLYSYRECPVCACQHRIDALSMRFDSERRDRGRTAASTLPFQHALSNAARARMAGRIIMARTRPCRVYWGSHGCSLERGHEGKHVCCCAFSAGALKAYVDQDDPEGLVEAGRAPYYGPDTVFFGEDAK